MKRSLLAAILIALTCLLAGGQAFAADKVVGDTKDACDAHNAVTFASKTGTATSTAGKPAQVVELPSSTREIYWYCAGSRERSANDTPFNAVKIQRAANGAIQWTFLVRSTPVAGDTPFQVGETKDACDHAQAVTFLNADSATVSVRAGEIKTADLPGLARQLSWNCGASIERSANDQPFNRVQLERAGNGALHWTFYRTLSVSGVGTGVFDHDVAGNLQAPTIFTQPQPGLLKTALSRFWDDPTNHAQIETKVRAAVPQGNEPGLAGALTLTDVHISDGSQLEVRVGQTADALIIKPVVHGNTIKAKITSGGVSANVTATFDIAVVLPFPRTQNVTVTSARTLTGLTLNNPQVAIGHVEIEGDGGFSGLMVGLLKSKVRANETQFDSLTRGFDQTFNDAVIAAIETQLAPLVQTLPPGSTAIRFDKDAVGDLRICPAQLNQCAFPAPSAAPPKARVLGTSTDKCDASRIWLWDSERGRFVSVAKGAAALVQVDDKRFEWYCGDETGPDPSSSHEESASGPTGTSQVQVSRDPDGRLIHWQFLFWR